MLTVSHAAPHEGPSVAVPVSPSGSPPAEAAEKNWQYVNPAGVAQACAATATEADDKSVERR